MSGNGFLCPHTPTFLPPPTSRLCLGIGGTLPNVQTSNCAVGYIYPDATTPTLNGAVGIRVKGDTAAESDETVIATLSIRSGYSSAATLGTSVVTHTIRDDDTPTPEISVSLPISEGERRSDAGEKKVAESEAGLASALTWLPASRCREISTSACG